MPDETMDDGPGRTELHHMLGIGRHTTSAELRLAYEQAVSNATRSGDMDRARQLVSAFEAMSRPRKSQVFGRVFSTAAGMDASQASPRPTIAARRRPKPRTVPDRKFGMARWARFTVYFVIAPLMALAFIESSLHPEWVVHSGNAPPVQPVVVPHVQPASTAPVTQTFAPNSRLVPLDTPVDSEGFVIIRCQVEPFNIQRPGDIVFARPGAIVACKNGSIPAIVR